MDHTRSSATPKDLISEPVTLAHVVCGVDGSDADAEAERQAAVIAGPEGHVERVSAGDWNVLAAATADRDLLVLGDNPHARASGIFHRSVSAHALHESAVPVLIARSGSDDFPRSILIASDGSESSLAATAIAAAIARAHSAAVTMLTVDHTDNRDRRHALTEEAAELERICGVGPEIVLRTGDPDAEIVAVARQLEPSLLVLGSGGKHGLRALGSVSEKVAHKAPCSVLVARHARA